MQSASGVKGDVLHLHEQGLALHIAETDVQVAGQPQTRQIEGRTIQRYVAEALTETGEEPVAEPAEADRFGRQFFKA